MLSFSRYSYCSRQILLWRFHEKPFSSGQITGALLCLKDWNDFKRVSQILILTDNPVDICVRNTIFCETPFREFQEDFWQYSLCCVFFAVDMLSLFNGSARGLREPYVEFFHIYRTLGRVALFAHFKCSDLLYFAKYKEGEKKVPFQNSFCFVESWL